MLHGIGTQTTAVDSGEQSHDAVGSGLLQPGAQYNHCVCCQWGTPFLAAFAEAANMRTSAEDDIINIELGELRQYQAGLHGEQQQSVISASQPRFCVGCCEDSLDLCPG